MLGMVASEDGVLQAGRGPQERGGDAGRCGGHFAAENGGEAHEVVAGDGFIERDADAGRAEAAQVETGLKRAGD
jgi:hypothetical protein